MPRLAAYLRRRAEGLRMTMAAHGDDGRTLWVAEANEAAWRVRLRVRDGALVPLDGPPARAPGKVRVTINYSFKAGLVRAGVRGLVAEVEPTAEAGERGFTARFVEQPDWQLPFLVEPLLRSSLRYPFEGNGSEFEVALRPESGRTELVGDSRLRLRESWIVRWLGGFTTKALEELRAAEVEADRYALECLTALREDVAERIGQGAIGQPGNRDRERTRGGQGRAMSAGRGAASRAEASGSTACNAGGSPPR
jgi:hypothetical protein